jgi:DNA-binding NarL/FixJ family response regulator
MRSLIVDDHALMRRGMAYIVEHGFPGADVVEAESASAALDVMRECAADLALVDVRMPDLDGLELLLAMKSEWPRERVIMLSTHENAPYVKRVLSLTVKAHLSVIYRKLGVTNRTQAAMMIVQVTESGRERPGFVTSYFTATGD